MTLNLNSVMLGSEDSKKLADFYTNVLGAPIPEFTDESTGWFCFQAGSGGLVIGPHSEVTGKNQQPGRLMINLETPDVKSEFERIKESGANVIAEPYEPGEGMLICTFEDADGNYFQLSSPWSADAK